MFVDTTLLSDVKSVLGKCADQALYRRLSDAVRLGNNQSRANDWQTATMDLCVCDGCVTLPADVGVILGLNVGGHPHLLRDDWFQYHINGTGSNEWVPWPYADELGRVATYKDPSVPVQLVAIVENSLDSGTELRVFGWDDNGKRIYTEGEDGILQDGFLVPTSYGFSTVHPTAASIARIDRISKEVTNGFIRLVAIDPAEDNAVHTQIGYYLPWETVPNYRRIRVPDRAWVRIKYKRVDLEVRGVGDWINMDNREALLLLVKAVKFRHDNQLEAARNYELEGMRLLSNEAEMLRPNAISPPQIIYNEFYPDEDRMHG